MHMSLFLSRLFAVIKGGRKRSSDKGIMIYEGPLAIPCLGLSESQRLPPTPICDCCR
jgi:hypothetical protein